MMRAVIVDDDTMACDSLNSLIKSYCPDVSVAGKAHTVEQAIRIIRKYKPDIVFLDIELNYHYQTGFDVLKAIPFHERSFDLIFVTGHQKYALEAAKACCIDFLLKPVDIDELPRAVENVRLCRSLRSTYNQIDMLSEIVANFELGRRIDRIRVPYQYGFRILLLDEIKFFCGDQNYTNFHLLNTNEKISVYKPASFYTSLLDGYGFVNIHNSVFANIDCIRALLRDDTGSTGGTVVFSDETTHEVSRRKKELLLEAFAKLSI